MAFTALATKVYKDPLTVQWMNSIKSNDDQLLSQSYRAAVGHDGQTATITAKYAFNISNIIDSGVGLFTYVFTSGFTSTNYVGVGSTQQDAAPANGVMSFVTGGMTTASFSSAWETDNGSAIDFPHHMAVFFGV